MIWQPWAETKFWKHFRLETQSFPIIMFNFTKRRMPDPPKALPPPPKIQRQDDTDKENRPPMSASGDHDHQFKAPPTPTQSTSTQGLTCKASSTNQQLRILTGNVAKTKEWTRRNLTFPVLHVVYGISQTYKLLNYLLIHLISQGN